MFYPQQNHFHACICGQICAVLDVVFFLSIHYVNLLTNVSCKSDVWNQSMMKQKVIASLNADLMYFSRQKAQFCIPYFHSNTAQAQLEVQ